MIRMRSHCLLWLNDIKSASSCQRSRCKLIVKTFYHTLETISFIKLEQVCKYQVAPNLILTVDFMQLDDKID